MLAFIAFYVLKIISLSSLSHSNNNKKWYFDDTEMAVKLI